MSGRLLAIGNQFLKDLALLRNGPQLAERTLHVARIGNVDAQYAMGLNCAEGRVVLLDPVKACAWLMDTELQGDRDAVILCNIVGSQLTDEEFESGKHCAAAYEKLTRSSTGSH